MFQKAVFLRSVGSVQQLICDEPNEIAVVGKSNVGKSSFINFLANNSKLAKVGKIPGKTRLINYFSIDNGSFTLVDLPGYGFARVSDSEKRQWGVLIETYLQKSLGLKHIFILVDIRRDPDDEDRQMLRYLYFYQIPFTVLATKSDKIGKSEISARKTAVSAGLGVGMDNVLVCSALSKTGKEEIFAKIQAILNT